MTKNADKLRQHYVPLIKEHGESYRAVDWGSEKSQKLRFKILCEIADVQNASILDVGCGVGHLIQFLKDYEYKGKYIGIDAVPEMIDVAQKNYPNHSFIVNDFLENKDQLHVEYVFESGIFTFADWNIVKTVITKMFNSCTKAVACNFLSDWTDQKEKGEFYANPQKMIEFCRSLTSWVSLRHDYMPHDFTVYLYRKQQR